MKTIKSFILALLLCSSLLSIGQERHADLAVEFRSPEPNANIQSPDVIHFSFVIFNNGPDTIYTTDSLTYRPSHTFAPSTPRRYWSFPIIVPPGDSILIRDTIGVNSSVNTSKFELRFTIPPIAYGNDVGHGRLRIEFENERSDNSPVLKLQHSGSLGMAKKSIFDHSIYPNPVNGDKLMIDLDHSDFIDHFTLMDLSGRDVSQQLLVYQDGDRVDLSGFETISQGLYILSFPSKGLSYSRKILVQ